MLIKWKFGKRTILLQYTCNVLKSILETKIGITNKNVTNNLLNRNFDTSVLKNSCAS